MYPMQPRKLFSKWKPPNRGITGSPRSRVILTALIHRGKSKVIMTGHGRSVVSLIHSTSVVKIAPKLSGLALIIGRYSTRDFAEPSVA